MVFRRRIIRTCLSSLSLSSAGELFLFLSISSNKEVFFSSSSAAFSYSVTRNDHTITFINIEFEN